MSFLVVLSSSRVQHLGIPLTRDSLTSILKSSDYSSEWEAGGRHKLLSDIVEDNSGKRGGYSQSVQFGSKLKCKKPNIVLA